jgi:RNA polymerase-binding transcription factor
VNSRTLDRHTKGELEGFLHAELARLEMSLRALARESRTAEKTALTDVNVHAADALETELQVTLLDRRTQQVAQVRGALERLSNGEYGLCQDCEAFVGLPRLRALPFAQRCRECQSQAERRVQREALAPSLELHSELEAA